MLPHISMSTPTFLQLWMTLLPLENFFTFLEWYMNFTGFILWFISLLPWSEIIYSSFHFYPYLPTDPSLTNSLPRNIFVTFLGDLLNFTRFIPRISSLLSRPYLYYSIFYLRKRSHTSPDFSTIFSTPQEFYWIYPPFLLPLPVYSPCALYSTPRNRPIHHPGVQLGIFVWWREAEY